MENFFKGEKMLIVENFFPLQTRGFRIAKSLITYNMKVDVCLWDRNGVSDKLKDTNNITTHVYKRLSQNKLYKLFLIYNYFRFIKGVLNKEDYKVILASHWDMLLLCSILKKRNQILIYDNLDIPTHRFYVVRLFLKFIEYLALLKTNGVIFASRFFKPLYDNWSPHLILGKSAS